MLTVDDFADDVDALMDALEMSEAVIGGLSMGGYVAFALCRRLRSDSPAWCWPTRSPQADSLKGAKAGGR